MIPGGSQTAYDYAGQDPVNTSDVMGTSFKYKNDGWQCGHAGCVHLTRKCAEPSGHCSLFWAAKLTGHWRSAYSVNLSYTILVEGHTVHRWQEYGHAEPGDYYWHASWGEHRDASLRGRYRYDLVFIGHVEGFSTVEIDFAGDVIMPGGKSYTLYGYGKWD